MFYLELVSLDVAASDDVFLLVAIPRPALLITDSHVRRAGFKEDNFTLWSAWTSGALNL